MICGRQLAVAVVSWMLAGVGPAAEPFTAKVVRVKDGDSLIVLHDGEQIDIRLEGIDCLESGQAFGQTSQAGYVPTAARPDSDGPAYRHGQVATARRRERTGTTGCGYGPTRCSWRRWTWLAVWHHGSSKLE